MFLAVLDIPSDWDGIQVEMMNEKERKEETRRHSKVGLLRLEMRNRWNAATNKEFNISLFSNSNARCPDGNRIPQQRKSSFCK